MKLQTDSALKIESSIARRRERIAKWDTEAGEVEASWTGGPDYRMFCQGMARAARENKEELEAKLKQLQARQRRNGNGPVPERQFRRYECRAADFQQTRGEFIGKDAASVTVANSYFLKTDGDGNILESTPKIVRKTGNP